MPGVYDDEYGVEYHDPMMYGGTNPDKPDFSAMTTKPQRQIPAQDATKVAMPPMPKHEGVPMGNEESQLRKRRFQAGTSADEAQLDSIRRSGGHLMDQGFKSSLTAHDVDSLRARYNPARGEAADIAWKFDSTKIADRTKEAADVLGEAQKEIHAQEKPKPKPLPEHMMAPREGQR